MKPNCDFYSPHLPPFHKRSACHKRQKSQKPTELELENEYIHEGGKTSSSRADRMITIDIRQGSELPGGLSKKGCLMLYDSV